MFPHRANLSADEPATEVWLLAAWSPEPADYNGASARAADIAYLAVLMAFYRVRGRWSPACGDGGKIDRQPGLAFMANGWPISGVHLFPTPKAAGSNDPQAQSVGACR